MHLYHGGRNKYSHHDLTWTTALLLLCSNRVTVCDVVSRLRSEERAISTIVSFYRSLDVKQG